MTKDEELFREKTDKMRKISPDKTRSKRSTFCAPLREKKREKEREARD
jgi:hypothetical protein